MTHTELDPLEDTETVLRHAGDRIAFSHTELDPLEDTETQAVQRLLDMTPAHTELDPLEDTETQDAGLGGRGQVIPHRTRSA